MEQQYRDRLRNSYWYIILLSLVVLPSSTHSRRAIISNAITTKTAVFLSPKLELEPGSVRNELYYDIEFPRGHIALKSFDAEVVDEAGEPVPLHEAYLHHWLVQPYLAPLNGSSEEAVFVRNQGLCPGNELGQYFGLGSETRRTPSRLPGPYGVEAGDPGSVPEGFEQRWMLNVHAIDTRCAADRLGCTECRCDLYNVTVDEYGRALREGYKGGLLCCYDRTRCRVREGFSGGAKRSLYLRYTVRWVDWSESVLPAKIYILDVTDDWKALGDDGTTTRHHCHVEYDVAESCSASNGCVDTRRNRVRIPRGGHVIYAVAHQHTGGIGSTLYGEDGRVLCKSNSIYGQGTEAGDEEGYIVGMSVCYPEPGSVEILDGETLLHESSYDSSQGHTGVMALFYVVVVDQLPNPDTVSSPSNSMLV